MTSKLINLLVTGASHTGKSTLCSNVAQATNLRVLSTDQIARHPGRPWPTVKTHVADFYTGLSDQSVFEFLLNHHENMWPGIKRMLLENQAAGSRSVLEGSALRPEYLATLSQSQNLGICLYANADFLRARIRHDSAFTKHNERQQFIIDKFIRRTIADNNANFKSALEFGIECVDVTNAEAVNDIEERLIEAIRQK